MTCMKFQMAPEERDNLRHIMEDEDPFFLPTPLTDMFVGRDKPLLSIDEYVQFDEWRVHWMGDQFGGRRYFSFTPIGISKIENLKKNDYLAYDITHKEASEILNPTHRKQMLVELGV